MPAQSILLAEESQIVDITEAEQIGIGSDKGASGLFGGACKRLAGKISDDINRAAEIVPARRQIASRQIALQLL